jgi:8-oxo-dGTP pyrophosphatase MutT (NUDIX family)
MPKKEPNFNVGLKTFFRWGDSFLALKDAYSEFWDLPGGGVDQSEIDQPITERLRHELLNQLGLNVIFNLEQVIDATQYRLVATNPNQSTINFIAVYYTATYQTGEIILSQESVKYEWLNKQTSLACPFGGQQKVVDRYVEKFLI